MNGAQFRLAGIRGSYAPSVPQDRRQLRFVALGGGPSARSGVAGRYG
jgi:hypothetical protein